MPTSLNFYHRVTGNFYWFQEMLRCHGKKSDPIVGLGAGAGDLGRYLLNYFAPPVHPNMRGMTVSPFPPTNCDSGGVLTWEGVPFFESMPLPVMEYTGIDKSVRPVDWPTTWHWRNASLEDVESFQGYNIVMGNWFCSHLKLASLKKLGDLCQSGPRLLIFNEPYKDFKGRFVFKLLNQYLPNVRTIDKLRAAHQRGFSEKELIEILQINQSHWKVYTHVTRCGSIRLIAQKTIL